MKKFYVCKGGLANGPFTIEKLVEIGVEKSDAIWCAGFRECKPAIRVRELKMIFETRQSQGASTAPLAHGQTGYVLNKKNRSKYHLLFVCSLVLTAVLMIYYMMKVL